MLLLGRAPKYLALFRIAKFNGLCCAHVSNTVLAVIMAPKIINYNVEWRLNMSYKNSLSARLALKLEWRLQIRLLFMLYTVVSPRSIERKQLGYICLEISTLYVDITFTRVY